MPFSQSCYNLGNSFPHNLIHFPHNVTILAIQLPHYLDKCNLTNEIVNSVAHHVGRFGWTIEAEIFSNGLLFFEWLTNLLEEKYGTNAHLKLKGRSFAFGFMAP